MKGKGGEGDNPGAKDVDTRPLETLKDRNGGGGRSEEAQGARPRQG